MYALDVVRGGSMGGDDSLEFGLDRHRHGTGINGWVKPYFDKEAGIPTLDVMDFSLLRSLTFVGFHLT